MTAQTDQSPKSPPTEHQTPNTEHQSIFSPTFDVTFTQIDGEVRVYTFRKAKSTKVLELDAAMKEITSAKEITEVDILNRLIPLIDAQLQKVAIPAQYDDNDSQIIVEPKVDLYYPDAVQLFFLMRDGSDCSYASKKDLGSPSPSGGDVSTHTITTQ